MCNWFTEEKIYRLRVDNTSYVTRQQVTWTRLRILIGWYKMSNVPFIIQFVRLSCMTQRYQKQKSTFVKVVAEPFVVCFWYLSRWSFFWYRFWYGGYLTLTYYLLTILSQIMIFPTQQFIKLEWRKNMINMTNIKHVSQSFLLIENMITWIEIINKWNSQCQCFTIVTCNDQAI